MTEKGDLYISTSVRTEISILTGLVVLVCFSCVLSEHLYQTKKIIVPSAGAVREPAPGIERDSLHPGSPDKDIPGTIDDVRREKEVEGAGAKRDKHLSSSATPQEKERPEIAVSSPHILSGRFASAPFAPELNPAAGERIRREDNFLGSVSLLAAGVYGAAFLHEMGHYREAEKQGLNPEVSLGVIRVNSERGGASVYLGRTSYSPAPRERQKKAELSLSGMSSARSCYRALDERIKRGELEENYYSLLALGLKSDFSRYALINSIKKYPDPMDDIETYITSTGGDRDFIYTCAGLDLLFDWKDIRYHWQRTLGENPPPPPEWRPWGWDAGPQVFVRRDIGIAVGLAGKKRW